MKNNFHFLAGAFAAVLLLSPLVFNSMTWAAESSTGAVEEGDGNPDGAAPPAPAEPRDANTTTTNGQGGSIKPKAKAKLNSFWDKLGADKDKDAPAPAGNH